MLLNLLPPLARAHRPPAPSCQTCAKEGARAAEKPYTAEGRPRMAYLVSRYPAVSHTFILREVMRLRELGFDIQVASINSPDRTEADMTPDEREEAARTYYVKKHGLGGALAAHFAGLRHPLSWLRGLGFALGLGGWNLKQRLFGFFYFTEALMLSRWMRAQGLTHLHVHFATAAANVGLVLKHASPIGLSLTVHGPDEFYDAPGEYLREKIAAADFLVCISRYAQSQLMHLSPANQWGKFEICPLGVDPGHYTPSRKSFAEEPFTILCVGRLTPAKGQRVLIEACRLLAQAGRSFRLVIVGAGPDAADLKTTVGTDSLEKVVLFTGALNQAEVRNWYGRADAFALPSFAEGVPVVLMEAMASGIPCVTTRITGIPELIRDGRDGLLVAPSDTEALASALECLMDEPNLATQLGSAGRARVQEKYDLGRNAARLADLFQRRLGATIC